MQVQMKKQQGVALVVGLVMLMVLTIMGVSSMRNSTLQLQVAKNTQEHNIAFQTSVASGDYAIRQADTTKLNVDQDFDYVMPNNTALTGKATTRYIGCARVMGGSLERAGSRNVFETTSKGYSEGGSRSTIVSAVGIRTPASCTDQ